MRPPFGPYSISSITSSNEMSSRISATHRNSRATPRQIHSYSGVGMYVASTDGNRIIEMFGSGIEVDDVNCAAYSFTVTKDAGAISGLA